ncbi:hypothetical protein PDJAM_G00259790 [Pangasius djambal]|nr:hypothetical protein [Pangasius djambal]
MHSTSTLEVDELQQQKTTSGQGVRAELSVQYKTLGNFLVLTFASQQLCLKSPGGSEHSSKNKTRVKDELGQLHPESDQERVAGRRRHHRAHAGTGVSVGGSTGRLAERGHGSGGEGTHSK